ncbi:Protein phosphatase 2C-like [Nitrobacter sp. Nb-311A]|uniref:PP2C family protein-serine/threonine phosphatase n=1 Tax=Nitrobacter sp. Nb-311A TaxID=314253 RepID=UPI0000686404|nr:protein phosphatase 2C domain-containing protein [Nitrobacter sp. Nb-311A]EAQ37510.1 Protein phosphatase 2C-like [Nitrobacter sp. Nb-311A]
MTGWTIAAFTHRGRMRPANEDAISVGSRVLTGDMSTPVAMTAPGDGCLLMVADGMGGHAQGALASRAVLDYLVAAADRLSNPETCSEVIEDANQHLYTLMEQQEAALGMGTTLVGAFLTPTALLTFNVGDSRSYLFSAGRLIQLSHDDVADDGINRSGNRRSHAITQALGGSSFPVAIEPHTKIDAPHGTDETLLLCSDGLTDMVDDRDIRHALSVANDPIRAVRDLVAKVFAVGARDNISVIVARPPENLIIPDFGAG